MRRQLIALALTLPHAAGCYSYARIQPAEIQPGVDVRARLSAITSDHIAPLLGTTPRLLTGKLISDARDTVVMEVPTMTQTSIGSTVQTLHQRVTVPKSGVIEWEIRTLNRTRTYALVGGAAAIFAAVLINALQGEPGSERLPGGGGVDALVPVFRISR
ncbi:MAG: hypothetical protein ACT4P6_05325 [Gemmatimonadaceae bacterium]